MTDETTGAQAPTPGPLSGKSVKLLVKGDLLRVIEAGSFLLGRGLVDGGVATVRSVDGPYIDVYGPAERSDNRASRFAFIGRPDADGWMPWSGGKNPVPGQRVDAEGSRFVGKLRDTPSDQVRWDRVARFRLAPTAPVEASGSEREAIVEAIKVAMKDAWEDHASDTGCWPADIKRVSSRGPLRLMFTPAIWAQTTAEWAAETILRNRPQPSGETREAVARLTKDLATVKSFSANAATFYDGPDKRYIGDVAADIETVLALLSARPLALRGQQGDA